MEKIKILVLKADAYGVGWFRSVSPHLYMKEHFSDIVDIDIVDTLPKTDLDKYFSQYDIIHFHKQLDNDCNLIKLMKFVGCKVIVDIDDHWDLGDDHPLSISAKKEQWYIPIINHLKLADYVSTTTPIFKKEIEKYNKNVLVFPNAIDPNDKNFQIKQTTSNRLRFGIICGSSHLKDIELLEGTINKLPQDVKDNSQFVLCGFDTNGTRTIYNVDTGEQTTRPILPTESVWYDYEKIITDNYNIVSNSHRNFLHQFIPQVDYPNTNEAYRRCWTKPIKDYYQHYENIDVLLVPLKENKFNSVKSQLKVIEAGFGHKAIIASNFGPYTLDLIPMIEKGGNINENGNALLVDQSKAHKQWAQYITKLVRDRGMVEKLKENLYNTVKDTYSLETICKYRLEKYLEMVK